MSKKPGSKAVVVYQGKLLLILRDNTPTIPYPSTWSTPGGGVEEGESPLEAVARELHEEICIAPSQIIELGITRYTDGQVGYRFLVPVNEDEYPRIRLGDEGQKLGWFTFDELLTLNLSPHSRMYYERYESDIRAMLAGELVFPVKDEVIQI